MEDSYKRIFGSKERVLVVFAHPDDAELYAGGTIARLVADRKTVRVVKVTSGGRGSRKEKISEADLVKLRESEDKKAMEVLGIRAEDNIYLRFQDGCVENSMDLIEKLVWQIREFQPEIVITHNPEDVVVRFDKDVNWINHRDHRNTGMSVIDATYPYSRDLSFFTSQFEYPNIQPGAVSEYLLVDSYGHSDEVGIDMTDFVTRRVEAHACHSSQYSMKAAQESADFFTLLSDGRRRERFRYVVAD